MIEEEKKRSGQVVKYSYIPEEQREITSRISFLVDKKINIKKGTVLRITIKYKQPDKEEEFIYTGYGLVYRVVVDKKMKVELDINIKHPDIDEY